MKGSSVTFSDFIKTRIEELKSIRDKKKILENQRQAITDKINALTAERDSLQKSLPSGGRDVQNPAQIKKTIEDMQKRYETTTLKPQEEKKMLADIKKMKDSIPQAERLLEIKPAMDALYDQKKGFNEQIAAFRNEIDSKSAEIDSVRKEQDDAREQRDDIKQQLDKISAEMDKVRNDLNGYYAQKDELREEFHKGKLEYEIEHDLIRHNEWIAQQKERLLHREKQKEERLAARKQQLADRPNPFTKEIDTCERLAAYCELLKKKLGLV